MAKFQIQKPFFCMACQNGPWENTESGKCCKVDSKIRIAFIVFSKSILQL